MHHVPSMGDTLRLTPNDYIVWVGQPRQGYFLRPLDYVTIPFRIVWCVFVLWFIFPLPQHVQLRFIGLLIGFVFLVSITIILPSVIDVYRRSKTRYIITNTHVHIQGASLFAPDVALPITSIPKPLLEKHDDTYTTLHLTEHWLPFGLRRRGSPTPYAFSWIEEAIIVKDLIEARRRY